MQAKGAFQFHISETEIILLLKIISHIIKISLHLTQLFVLHFAYMPYKCKSKQQLSIWYLYLFSVLISENYN